MLASFSFGLVENSFNASLAQMKKTVRRGPTIKGRGERVHPALEMLINAHARKLAVERTGQNDAAITQDDVERAAAKLATKLPSERGRPRAGNLEHHVGGFMALVQETSGLPVLSSRGKKSGQYDPQLEPGVSKLLLILREVDPSITETQLANKVLELRRAYAGKAMRFRDFYPLYGATIDDEGKPECAPPYRLESFQPCHPIYCR